MDLASGGIEEIASDPTYDVTGVHPPEHVGAVDACYSYMLAYLAERGVHYRQRTENL